MLASIVGTGLAAVTAMLAYTSLNAQHNEVVDTETDLKWMQASIDAMPQCHFLAYGSVRAPARPRRPTPPGALLHSSEACRVLILLQAMRAASVSSRAIAGRVVRADG